MTLAHKKKIEENFGRACGTYNDHALVQKQSAQSLAALLPPLQQDRLRILEIGCGTGFLTRHLADLFPRAEITVTDISPAMVKNCERSFAGAGRSFHVMDGENPHLRGPFDLIVSGMTFQWFERPRETLQKLRNLLMPDGKIVYSTLGKNSFHEWKSALARLDLPCGVLDGQTPENILKTENLTLQFPSGPDFLASLRNVGARAPVPGYRPLSPRQLKTALALFEDAFDSKITYEVHYAQCQK